MHRHLEYTSKEKARLKELEKSIVARGEQHAMIAERLAMWEAERHCRFQAELQAAVEPAIEERNKEQKSILDSKIAHHEKMAQWAQEGIAKYNKKTADFVGTLATGVSRCLQLFEIRIRARNFCNRYMVSKRVQNNIQVVRGCGYLWKTSEWPVAVPFPSDFGKSNGDGQGPQVGVRTEDRNPLPDFALSRANAPGSLLRRIIKLVTAEEDLHVCEPRWSQSG